MTPSVTIALYFTARRRQTAVELREALASHGWHVGWLERGAEGWMLRASDARPEAARDDAERLALRLAHASGASFSCSEIEAFGPEPQLRPVGLVGLVGGGRD